MAAVLAAGGDPVISHITAAALWELPGFPEPDGIDLLVEGRMGPRLEGVRAHSTTSLPASHRTTHHHLPVTTSERTLVDACGKVSVPVLEKALDHALRRKQAHLPRLVRVVHEVPVSGRRRETGDRPSRRSRTGIRRRRQPA
ncbi:MAG TPA: hypothetical protein VFO65_03465 [Acidimicrobiales bacterium]|nr:hypothetical protein [Acidimicrobiales bacterium]